MIYSYGVTQTGQYHIKNNTVCQDSHCIKIINEHFAIAAVADGLGSEKYSDIASKIAAEDSVKYCCENITEDDTETVILSVIKASFEIALNNIRKTAQNNQHDINEYDTTLALTVFINGNVYFGNSGDSGIVVLNSDGTYENLTEQQRDENGCVFPLYFGEDKWVFGSKNKVASVLLATDGIYETLFPYLLRGEDEEMYIALARYLMSEESLGFENSEEGQVQKQMYSFIESIPGDQVSDDKTVVVLVDTSVKVEKQPDEYYQAPDWAALKKKRDEEYRRAAYPHLFDDSSSEK